jgi:hypothetical protein
MNSSDWSPADNPYAIAVSQAQLWRDVVRLTILRMRDPDDRRAGVFSSRQLDAHILVMTLRQLLVAEELEQAALTDLQIDANVSAALAQARTQFEGALPGIKDMRDALMHFDQWTRGTGWGPQRRRAKAGEALRDIARDYSSFGYDPETATISFGPYAIHIDAAENAAIGLCDAIYMAARAVDDARLAKRRRATIAALERAGIACDGPEAVVNVSPGTDRRIWISLRESTNPEESDLQNLARRAVEALEVSGLRLRIDHLPKRLPPAQCLVRRQFVEVAAAD